MNRALDNSVDSILRYSQFIGQFNSLKVNLVLCNQILLIIYLSHIVVNFYGNIVQFDFLNVVKNEINRLGIYFRYLIIHIAGYYVNY